MSFQTIKSTIAAQLSAMKSKIPQSPILFIALAFLIFAVVGLQQYCDKRAEQSENERIAAYEREIQQKNADFQKYLEMANNDHRTTTTILDAMTAMSKNINDLAENDKNITARVNQIAENEYAAARNQKNNQTPVSTGKAKNTKPLSVREVEALKVDDELYPNNSNE